jgi:hypothetical protein
VEFASIVFSCLIGGTLLWHGSIWGYRFCLLGWILLIYHYASNTIVSFTDFNKNIVYISLSAAYIVGSIPIFYILIRDILNKKSKTNE